MLLSLFPEFFGLPWQLLGLSSRDLAVKIEIGG
jgi:hypothetical protein